MTTGNLNRFCAGTLVLAAFAAAVTVPMHPCAAQSAETAVTCTNPVNGASWQILIDYRNSTVDANRARITPSEISWFDPKDGGNYTLDRKSGGLVASVASSTGGYFRRAQCDLAKSS